MTPQGRMPAREITHDDRIRALARYVCRMETRRERRGFLKRYEHHNGPEMADELRRAVAAEWQAGKGR